MTEAYGETDPEEYEIDRVVKSVIFRQSFPRCVLTEGSGASVMDAGSQHPGRRRAD